MVMATSCVLGNGLNTARLGGEKKGKRKCQQEELTWESQAEADPKTCPPEFRLTSWTLHVQEQICATVLLIKLLGFLEVLFSGCARG